MHGTYSCAELRKKNLSFKIADGEKVGVVGRTGAGKSSLVLALLRMVKLSEGCIKVGGTDISQVFEAGQLHQ